MKKHFWKLANMSMALILSMLLYQELIGLTPEIGGLNIFVLFLGFGGSYFINDFEGNFSSKAKIKHIVAAGVAAPFWFLVRKPFLK